MAEFNKHAAGYDRTLDECLGRLGESSAYFREYKARYAARVLADVETGPVLDFGCGIGSLSENLRQLRPTVQIDGFDPSDDSIRRVPSELTAQGKFTSRLEEVGDGYALVLVSNVLHHVPPARRPGVFSCLRDRLRPNGRLLVFEHNPVNPATRWIVAHCAFDDDAVLLPVRETRARCREAGLRVQSLDYILFFPGPLRALRPLEERLRWCPAGAQYALVAARPEGSA